MKQTSPVKVLHVSTLDTQGGAARATYRLHSALKANNVDSKLLVQNKSSDDPYVITETGITKKIINRLRPTLDSIPVKFYKNRGESLFSPAYLPFSNIAKKINGINPDIVHLHWVCHGMIKIEDLNKIKAPIVWTLHDNWAFTGGCHIMWECKKYQDACGCCPRLGSDSEKDLSRRVFNRKSRAFPKVKHLTVVGVSSWLAECAKRSPLFKNRNIVNLPNPLNTNKFKPFDKNKARELWNLPKDKKLILFGANSATADLNKGFKELCSALRKLKSDDIELVIFGSSEPEQSQNLGFAANYLGHVFDDVSLLTIYSAADVMIVPSLQEAFGQTASESMACGTPVVAFGHTGLLDIIDHKENGYLATPIDSDDLAKGIDWVLNVEADIYEKLCLSARNKVINEFDNEVVAKKYIKLYEKVINETHQ
ncbi:MULTISPECIES: glycosyltransferase family 4 protein [unclassified Pseudoalteromonas]|uniref:glycosyltransferase family 4 protein n=1 Tax=unclassified Pseudoalteromonas TaxID=194690 RepID=UPI001108DB1C|nr:MULTISPECIES: glycosyltransferase family 4 protein [unclassified Pseudoalteromonas]TMN78116.1 glycosyl transferase family 1 [Pseudoalteromonas sp. S410]TMN90454.1 glycosyl transferase family 1 [Pseudoalteromonas sp. S408]TMN96466.1 glycosyl transferase family 1 [Pseudoalteromonas sp. S407]TMO00607.1 glycosyl transferase family 1 [Pseudoalteromonas sp. S409]TMO07575.1 glycosyl transferase family 1 [Pseudoalteromonas sp. S186]